MVKKAVLYGSIVLGLILCCIIQKEHSGEIEYSCFGTGQDAQAVELYDGVTFCQMLTRPAGDIAAVSINIPTFQRTELDGVVDIQVWNNDRHVAGRAIDAAKISDGEAVRIKFEERTGAEGDQLKIEISASSSMGKCAGLWICPVKQDRLIDPYISMDGERFSGVTNMSIMYEDCRLSFVWVWMMAYVLVLFIASGKYSDAADWCARKHVMGYVGLFAAACAVFCLRGGVSACSAVYAEDGTYVSNILNAGFWQSCLTTRSGGGNDFFNLGSYLLLELSIRLNQVFHGYDLEYLPLVIGVVSSMFWASIAVFGYGLYESSSRFLAAAVYVLIVCIPVGSSTMEIFGRVLNEVFLFPVLAALLLSYLWKMRYEVSIKSACCDMLLLLCGLSFPVSFGALGIWMLIGLCCACKDSKVGLYIKANGLKIVTLLVGLLLLPAMIGSQGASAGMAVKGEALTEFVIGRHLLYAFTYLFYSHLNDILVWVMFGISVLVVVTALYYEYQEKACGYFVFVCMGMGCIFASAYMRLPMSSLFEQYQFTYPDRYYYGCNILYGIIVLHGLEIIAYKNKPVLKICRSGLALFIFSLCINAQLFPKVDRDFLIVRGKETGIEDWKDCLEDAVNSNRINNGSYTVLIHPMTDNGVWTMELPEIYVWASVK